MRCACLCYSFYQAPFSKRGTPEALTGFINTIAQRVGLPKASVHYCFNNTLGFIWLCWPISLSSGSTFNTLAFKEHPAEALARYIQAKTTLSRRYLLASCIFAVEIVGDGTCLYECFDQDYRNWFRQRAAVFEAWIKHGKMDPVDPVHLIFVLRGST